MDVLDVVDAEFRVVVSKALTRYSELEPERAVIQGRFELAGQVADRSAAGLEREISAMHEMLTRLEFEDPSDHGEFARLEYHAVLAAIKGELFDLEMRRRPWRDPSLYLEVLSVAAYLERDDGWLPPARAGLLTRAALGWIDGLGHAERNLEQQLPRVAIEHALGLAKERRAEITDVRTRVIGSPVPPEAKNLDTALGELLAALEGYERYLHERRAHASDDFALGAEALRELLERAHGYTAEPSALMDLAAATLARDVAELGEPHSNAVFFEYDRARDDTTYAWLRELGLIEDRQPWYRGVLDRPLVSSTAEGWTSYAEALASHRSGTHPELIAAALICDLRLLAVLGLHREELDLDGAVDLFRAHGFDDESEREAQLCAADPGVLACGLGRAQILALRDVWHEWEGRDVTDNSLREFHTELRIHGNAPLPAIKATMQISRGLAPGP